MKREKNYHEDKTDNGIHTYRCAIGTWSMQQNTMSVTRCARVHRENVTKLIVAYSSSLPFIPDRLSTTSTISHTSSVCVVTAKAVLSCRAPVIILIRRRRNLRGLDSRSPSTAVT